MHYTLRITIIQYKDTYNNVAKLYLIVLTMYLVVEDSIESHPKASRRKSAVSPSK
jgi:hypothetical protein